MKWGSGRWWVKAPCLKWEPKATSVVPYFLAFSCPLSVFSSAMCVDQTYMKITLHQAIILKIQQLWDSLSASVQEKRIDQVPLQFKCKHPDELEGQLSLQCNVHISVALLSRCYSKVFNLFCSIYTWSSSTEFDHYFLTIYITYSNKTQYNV